MVLPSTPFDVLPPLEPENAVQGGEYGSLGTCSLRSGQPPAEPGATAPSPPAPPAAPSPPLAPSVTSAPSGVVTTVSGPLSPEPSEPELDATVLSCTLDGTRTDMSSSISANTASGP